MGGSKERSLVPDTKPTPPPEPMATERKSSRGIPPQEFIENVPEYTKAFGDAQAVITAQQEMYSKYKFMEAQMAQHRNAVAGKRAEIEKSLDILERLIAKRDNGDESLKTHFQLGDCLHANADIPTNEDSRVCLWLGANVMLEYTYDDALELLSNNKTQAGETVESLDEDLDFIKDQITTTEVNIARVYNQDVRDRRAAKASKPQNPTFAESLTFYYPAACMRTASRRQ